MNLGRHIDEQQLAQRKIQAALAPASHTIVRSSKNIAQQCSNCSISSISFIIQGHTALDAASKTSKHENAVAIIFKRGVGRNLPSSWLTATNLLNKDKEGKTALHYAAQYGWANIPTEHLIVDNLTIADKNGHTALERSFHWMYWKSLPFLKEVGWVALSDVEKTKVRVEASKLKQDVPKELAFITKDCASIQPIGAWNNL